MTTDLADRYGAPPRWRRPVTIGLAVTLAVVSLTWLAWTAWFHSTPAASSDRQVATAYELRFAPLLANLWSCPSGSAGPRLSRPR